MISGEGPIPHLGRNRQVVSGVFSMEARRMAVVVWSLIEESWGQVSAISQVSKPRHLWEEPCIGWEWA